MKKFIGIWIFRFAIIEVLLMLLISCKKDDDNPTNKDAIIFNPNLTYDTVSDIDGNIYKAIKIGTQTWMAENLKTTRYNDGTEIPLLTNSSEWSKNTSGYCWYENNSAKYKNTYGALYKWNTVKTNYLCPIGWHLPSDSEWLTLINFTGSEMVSGRSLKEDNSAHWLCPEYGGDNLYGFTALPGGCRGPDGSFGYNGIDGIFWTSSEKDVNDAYDRVIYSCFEDIAQDWAPKNYGFSVRCVKD